jgi:SAM-dependent methyltransferase
MARDREFYETTYHFDEDVEMVDEARMSRALDRLEPMAGRTFLDLGSGVGWAARMALKRGADRAIGLDFALRALRLGQQAMPEVDRVQADGCRLPVRDGAVDRLLSFGSLEHFPDVAAGLREIARVLSAGGRAVIVVPNFYVRTEQPRELRLSRAGWSRLITAAGLRVVTTRADFGPPVMRDKRPARIVFRAGAKVLGLVPGLQYQFIFELVPAAPASG